MSAFNKDELRIVGHLVKLGYVEKSNRYVIAADLAHEERLYRDKVKKLSKDDKSKLREKEKMNLQTSKIEFNTGKSQEQKDKEMKQKEELGVLDRCKKAREAKKTKSDAKSSDAEPDESAKSKYWAYYEDADPYGTDNGEGDSADDESADSEGEAHPDKVQPQLSNVRKSSRKPN
tara:strand:+ start:232 stop:756 length:525 start_codon:yes stop_codon:yes gene_type:complete